jgi:dTDP-4-amino-4,6-dideoxy-D-galactose acyltransferase
VTVACSELAWDTEFFGRRIGRVEARRISEADLPAITDWIAEERIECTYFLADSSDPATVHAAETGGFRLVGIRVELERSLPAGGPPAAGIGSATLREVRESDRAALIAIASVSHEDTRFYADPGFPRERAAALYARWVERSCFEGFSGAAFVADLAGHAVGYITVSVGAHGGIIDLLGVDASLRGHGLGRLLIRRALDWFAEQGRSTASVATQGRNIAAQRFYQNSGFRTSQVHLWYHRWSTFP